jgi:hypothetical protein
MISHTHRHHPLLMLRSEEEALVEAVLNTHKHININTHRHTHDLTLTHTYRHTHELTHTGTTPSSCFALKRRHWWKLC